MVVNVRLAKVSGWRSKKEGDGIEGEEEFPEHGVAQRSQSIGKVRSGSELGR